MPLALDVDDILDINRPTDIAVIYLDCLALLIEAGEIGNRFLYFALQRV